MAQSEYWTELMRRQISRRSLLRTGSIAGTGLWVASTIGCGEGGKQEGKPKTAVDEPRQGGTLAVHQTTDPRGLDPHMETWSATMQFASNTYNALVKHNFDSSKILPDMAESWEQPDEVSYIFKIAKGAKFHNLPPVNGREFVAEDAKYSIERQMTDMPGKFQHAYYFLGKMAKIEAVDKYTIKFVTNEPYAPFMSYMANPWTVMIAREVVEKYGDLSKVAIGTGPFILKEYTRNVEAVFVRNPDYFRKGKPYLDEFRIRYVPDASTAVAMFLGDELDILAVDFTEIERVKKAKPNASYITMESWFPINLRTSPYDDKRPHKPPFNDKRVRQAIQLAVDKQEFVKIVRSGWGVPQVGMIRSNHKPYALPESDTVKQDIPKAKRLLAEAGLPNGFKTEILCAQSNAENAQVAKDQLAKIGIDAEVKPMEQAQYYNVMYSFDYQMSVHTNLCQDDPDEALQSYYGKNATYFRWGNQDIWKKIEEQSRLVKDNQKRVQLVQEIQRILLDDVGQIPLYVTTWPQGAQARVRGYVPAWNSYDQRYEDIWVTD